MRPLGTVSWSNREKKNFKFLQIDQTLLFLKVLTEKHKDEELNQVTDLGTCGLHTVYNAFKQEKKVQVGNSKN